MTAEIFTYLDEPAPYLDELGLDRAAAVLAEMDADEAVDILENLDPEEKEALIARMDQESLGTPKTGCNYIRPVLPAARSHALSGCSRHHILL